MAQKSSNTAKFIGIGCALFLLFGACCGSGVFYCAHQMQRPASYAHGLLLDIRQQNLQQALGRMNTPYQTTHDLNAFTQAVATLPELSTHTDASFSSVNISNGVTHLSGQLVTPTGSVPISMS